MFFWSLILLVEPLIYALSVYLIDVFLEKKDSSLKKKIGIFSLLLPVIFLLPTKLTLTGFDLTNCYREATEGFIATYYIYFIEIVYVIWILYFALKKYRKALKEAKREIIFFTLGIVLFLLSLASGNIVGSVTENWTLAQIGLFSMPLFAIFLGYMIVRFKTFNIKILGAQGLVFALGLSVIGIVFVRSIENARIVAIATFLLIIIVGYLLIKGVKKDVEQKEELAKLNVDLEKLIQQRESLMHLINHKVKGSFTRTKYIFSEMVNGGFGEISPELKRMAQAGLESDEGGVKTVDLILNASNLQKGIVNFDIKKINLKDTVFSAIGDKKDPIERKGIKLKIEIEDGDYPIMGDAFWLNEVVENLIDNSIHYTKGGEITVGLQKNNKKILFYVKDTGIGIDPEDKKRLFTEGGRGQNSVKVNVDSTGYGLYSVKLIIDAHKAKVWAESAGENKGAQFFVEFDAV